MKKFLAILPLLCIAASMSAQDSVYYTDDLKPTFSVELGYNHLFDNIKYWNLPYGLEASGDTRKYNGFCAGFGVDFPLSDYFAIKTGLSAMFDAGNGRNSALTAPYKGTNFGVIVPVFIKWCLQGESLSGVNLFAGPIANLGIISRSKTTPEYGSLEYDNYAEGGAYGNGIKRFNLLLGGGIGYDYQSMFGVRVGFYGGVINEFKDKEEGKAFRNRIEVTLSYYFN